ncbi:hemoglobin/transferrin/lactoferrin receptor protein [Alteromonas sp. I10]|uniref:TonB-dependent receptor n=1 Tax=Alteromonas TaxID=226 RepID=UPI000D76655F|nr:MULTISPECIES: TonB-dependent receptor [Alteromonas]MEC7509950.1 TonB-dependent receptor [Pseudomonadota bacterium]MEC8964459.1 TonB-dependent receptor [Pseudomonadota bacterium]PXW73521.1 hemoglobin/transferrin/lactoferrin receptor protein [Alteromonas sp. I10]TAP29301.1 TonB-dependent receptor [Alteromonas sp. KUL17]GEA02684.1 ligand-gated channel [Alteromonas sp. KUL17]
MKKLVLASAVCTLSSPVVFAQSLENQNEETKSIERVAVVGAATNLSITAEDIEQFQANDLADVFRESPSVSVGGSVGVAQKIFIRGLEDAYLNVTVDGAQQTSTLFHHIGRVTLDPDLLKQIDVQAGAGEATSGPGAIGGSIRFKTKDAQDLLRGDEQFGGRVKASYFSNEGTRYSGSLYGKLSDSWGLLGYYSTVDRDNFEDGDGNEVLGTAADQDLMFLKASGYIADNQYLSISAEQRDEEGEFSARPNWVVLEGAPLYPSEAERDTYVANYRFDHSALVFLEATAYQTSSSFRGGRFDFLSDIDTYGFDIRNTTDISNHVFTYGIDYRKDEVESGPGVGPVQNAEEGSVMGIYAQAHSNITPELLLSYGVRYDDFDFQQQILIDDYYGTPVTDEPSGLDDNELSFNVGLEYQLTEAWTLGLGYAEAARGKQIGDGFTLDEYLYDGEDVPVVASDVVPETVTNIEASIEYSANNLNARLSAYESTIDDVLFSGYQGNSVFNNIGDLESSGVEFNLAYRWDSVDVYFGFSSVDVELMPREGLYSVPYNSIDINGYEFVGLGNSRGDTWVLGADYTVTADISVGFNITMVDDINIDTLHQALENGWTDSLYSLNKADYTLVDIYGEWEVTNDLRLNLAVTNLFDEAYIDHSSVGDYSEVFPSVIGPQEAGRDIRLSVTYDF